MKKPDNQKVTNADYETVEVQKKLEKIFNYNPEMPLDICPIRDVLSPASDKWSILIILFLGGYQVLRFGSMKKLIRGISSKVLSERLKTLERDGYLNREVFPEVPVRVEYRLTALGRRYLDILLHLSVWIKEEMDLIIESRTKYDKSKRPFKEL